MNTDELFHVWANQRKTSGKSGNVFFDGPTCYSYGRHFQIATLKTLEGGTAIALLNPAGYSQSNSKHKTQAARAIHSRQIHHLNPRKWDGVTDRATLDAALAEEAAADAANVEAGKTRKREDAKRARERKKLEKMDLTEKVALWRAGAGVSLPYGVPVVLRLTPDGKRVETSRGAVIPARAATAAWRLIQAGQQDPAFDWGNYAGLEVLPDGIRVGCHVIPMDEVKTLADALKIA